MRSVIFALKERISFYEWAYGYLAEADSDIGAIAEFVVGRVLGCLPPRRKVHALHDLKCPGGLTIEVKASSRPNKEKGHPVQYEWQIRTQVASLSGKKEISRLWLFVCAAFPSEAASERYFDVFDPKYWTVYPLLGSRLVESGIRVKVKESTLRKLGVRPLSLSDLPAYIESGSWKSQA